MRSISAALSGVVSGLTVLNCANCGMEFGISVDFETRRRDDHKSFYCPNGHPQSFPGKTENEKEIARLKLELNSRELEAKRATERAKWAESSAHGARISAGRAKAAMARVSARVHAGVCPHCNRTFKQLASHMKQKHQEKM